MLCIAFTSISFIIAVTIFIWTAYLIYGEDKQIRGQGWSFYEVIVCSINYINILFSWSKIRSKKPQSIFQKHKWTFIKDCVTFQENFLELNRIVSNTRVAMYSLHMVLSPIQGNTFS